MLRLNELIAVIQMERSVGPKACGCPPSRDCAHDPPEPRRSTEEIGELVPKARVRCVIDPESGEQLYTNDCQHGVTDEAPCPWCAHPEAKR